MRFLSTTARLLLLAGVFSGHVPFEMPAGNMNKSGIAPSSSLSYSSPPIKDTDFEKMPVTVDGKALYPSLRNFASKKELVDSYLWNYFTHASTEIAALTTAIYLEDTKTILVLAQPRIRDLVLAGKERLGIAKKNVVRMTEIDLGDEILSVGLQYYPLVTASALHSSGIAVVEREVSQAYRVSFSPAVNRVFGLMVLSLKVVVGATFGSEITERETITCAANPGGQVQLQVSNRMLHFPGARTRELDFDLWEHEFVPQPWEQVLLSVADEEHIGALFYESFSMGKHRCVTNTSHFEDVGMRRWLEWTEPYVRRTASPL